MHHFTVFSLSSREALGVIHTHLADHASLCLQRRRIAFSVNPTGIPVLQPGNTSTVTQMEDVSLAPAAAITLMVVLLSGIYSQHEANMGTFCNHNRFRSTLMLKLYQFIPFKALSNSLIL